MNSEDVKKLLIKTFSFIEKHRNECIKKVVDERQKRYNDSWARRAFKRPLMTYDEALADVEENDWSFKLRNVKSACSLMENTAYKLLLATKYSAIVNITIDDLDQIGWDDA